MKKDDDEINAVQAATHVAVAGLMPIMIGAAPSASVAAATTAFMPRLVGALGRAVQVAHERRLKRWLESLAKEMSFGSPETIEQLMRDACDEGIRDALLESYRRLMGILSEAAIPILAKLTATCVKQDGRPDAFFRSVGSLLDELDADDCAFATELLLKLEPYSDVSWTGLQVEFYMREDQRFAGIRAWRPEASEPECLEVDAWDTYDRSLRVLALLKRFDLAHDNAAGFTDTTSGPHVARLQPAVVRRLLPLFTEYCPAGAS